MESNSGYRPSILVARKQTPATDYHGVVGGRSRATVSGRPLRVIRLPEMRAHSPSFMVRGRLIKMESVGHSI
jgi:hypothetical protein